MVLKNHGPNPVMGLDARNIEFILCEQQSALGLNYWLSRKYNRLTCYMQTFSNIARLCSSVGWFEPYLAETPIESHYNYNVSHTSASIPVSNRRSPES